MFSEFMVENKGISQAFSKKSSVSMSRDNLLILKERITLFIICLPDVNFLSCLLLLGFRDFSFLFPDLFLKGLMLTGMKNIQTLILNISSEGTTIALKIPGSARWYRLVTVSRYRFTGPIINQIKKAINNDMIIYPIMRLNCNEWGNYPNINRPSGMFHR